jgi:hypothetical protein
MRTIAIALGTVAVALAGTAFAQAYPDRNYPYDPQWGDRDHAHEVYRDNNDGPDDRRGREQRWTQTHDGRANQYECWNPHAGHFEGVRPGERQDDLDFSRCRGIGGGRFQEYSGR